MSGLQKELDSVRHRLADLREEQRQATEARTRCQTLVDHAKPTDDDSTLLAALVARYRCELYGRQIEEVKQPIARLELEIKSLQDEQLHAPNTLAALREKYRALVASGQATDAHLAVLDKRWARYSDTPFDLDGLRQEMAAAAAKEKTVVNTLSYSYQHRVK